MERKITRNQKTYSLPLSVAEWLRKFFEENKDDLTLMGITTETKLLEVLARNGEQAVHEILGDLKARREARKAQLK